MRTRHAGITTVALVLMALTCSFALADRIGYGGVVDLSAETDTVRAEHHHNWSSATHDARWKMISTTQDPFTADNNYAYLQLREKATGAVLFRRPCPALSHIWISPDSKYVVGLSNIKVWNPYQLVVYNKYGDLLLKRDMVGVKVAGAEESVTNWIFWYKKAGPEITIVENGTTAMLSIEGPLGAFLEFQFPAVK